MSTKIPLLLFVAALLIGAGVYLFGGNGGQPVEAAPVTTAPIRELVEDRGKTRLPRTWNITMPFAGRVEALAEFPEGQPVKQGTIVARVVPADLGLKLAAMTAAKERMDAAIQENDDVTVEQVTLSQTHEVVRSMKSSVQAAQERLQSGKAKYNFAKKNLDRIRELWKNKTKSEEDRDAAELQFIESDVEFRQNQLILTGLQAMLAATELMPVALDAYIKRKTEKSGDVLKKQRDEAVIQWQEAERDQKRGTMTSPINGVVLERGLTDEQYVSAGTMLLKLGNLDELEVEVDILSQDVVNVKPGQAAEILGPAIGPTLARGKVTRIFPAGFTKVSSLGVEQQRVKVIVAFEPSELARLRKERELGVDFRVRVKIVTAEKSSATVIPRSALFRGADSRWMVFAIRGGKAELQPITVGLMNDETVEVTNGLQVGEQVVLAPETNLESGTRVSSITREPASSTLPVGGE